MNRRLAIVATLSLAACAPQAAPVAAPKAKPHRVVVSEAIDPTTGIELALTTTTTERHVHPRPTRSLVRPRPVVRPRVAPPRGGGGDVWRRLAECESGNRQDAVGGGGRYFSYFQWTLATWRSVGGAGDPRDASYDEQVALAQRLQARSGFGQWPACSRKIGVR